MGGTSVQHSARASPLLVALLAFAVLCFTPQLFSDGDTSWHLATGQWIAEHRAIPHQDPFSFTMRGQPWTAHEWLVDIAMAGAFAAAGWAGLALLFSFAVALAIALLACEMLRWLAPRHVIALLALLGLILAPFLLARPHVITWPLLAIWTIILLRAREQGRAPPLYWALLITLWANLHASYIFALALAAAFALEALVEQRGRRLTVVREWGLFGLIALGAALITPHGLQGFLYPFQVSGMKALPLIQEWRATNFAKDWAFVLLVAAALVTTVLRWRSVGPVRFVLLAVLAALAFDHARHQPLFAIVTVLVLARTISGREQPSTSHIPRGIIASLAGALVLITAARLAMPLERHDGRTYPVTAISKVPDSIRSRAVLNSYSFGGPLILHGIPAFIDGRADMYGDDFTIMHSRILNGDRAAFEGAVRRWNFKWTILEPGSRLVGILDRTPGWRRLHADRWAVVHVRDETRGKQAAR